MTKHRGFKPSNVSARMGPPCRATQVLAKRHEGFKIERSLYTQAERRTLREIRERERVANTPPQDLQREQALRLLDDLNTPQPLLYVEVRLEPAPQVHC